MSRKKQKAGEALYSALSKAREQASSFSVFLSPPLLQTSLRLVEVRGEGWTFTERKGLLNGKASVMSGEVGVEIIMHLDFCRSLISLIFN